MDDSFHGSRNQRGVVRSRGAHAKPHNSVVRHSNRSRATPSADTRR